MPEESFRTVNAPLPDELSIRIALLARVRPAPNARTVAAEGVPSPGKAAKRAAGGGLGDGEVHGNRPWPPAGTPHRPATTKTLSAPGASAGPP